MIPNPSEKMDDVDLNGQSNEGFEPEDTVNNDLNNTNKSNMKKSSLDSLDSLEPSQEYKFQFSFRMLWAFTGPGWLMSIAYLDPGNIEADLQSGSVAQYKLLWVLLLATCAGFVVQRLSARLGIVSGKHLAEACEENYPKVPNFLLWIMVEIAVIGSDMQEVIGTALALYLITDKHLPLPWGCLITIADTFTFLFLDRYGRRKLEFFFAFLILVMGISFGVNYIADLPDQGEVALGVIYPRIPSYEAGLQAVATAGAVIMPHNLYLHSGLVSNRKINRKCRSEIRDANFYTALEGAIALFASFIISLFVVSVFGNGFYGKTNREVHKMCIENDARDWWASQFNCNNTDSFCDDWDAQVEPSIFLGGLFLGCSFGIAYCYIWAVGILASGQASTMTGTYAGQFCMQGFLGLKWAQWKILVVTRLTAMLPTLLIAFFTDIHTVSQLNDHLNIVMFIMLPFAVLPCLTFTSSRIVMGQFKNGLFSKIITTILSAIVIIINFSSAYEYFDNLIPKETTNWYWWTLVVLFAIIYFFFLVYLIVYMFICLGFESLIQYPVIQRFYRVEVFLQIEQTEPPLGLPKV